MDSRVVQRGVTPPEHRQNAAGKAGSRSLIGGIGLPVGGQAPTAWPGSEAKRGEAHALPKNDGGTRPVQTMSGKRGRKLR